MVLAFFLGLSIGIFLALGTVAGIIAWRLLKRTDLVENALKNVVIKIDEGGESRVEKTY